MNKKEFSHVISPRILPVFRQQCRERAPEAMDLDIADDKSVKLKTQQQNLSTISKERKIEQGLSDLQDIKQSNTQITGTLGQKVIKGVQK